MKQPNIILIMTDQQRYDTIAALGFPQMQTPNLDRLAQEGACFEQCYCTAPSCVPSRASFFNCRYSSSLQVFHNGCPWNTSWVEQLRDSGYHCMNVGKMHTVPMDADCGFHQRFIVENKDRPGNGENGKFWDEWERFLLFSGVSKPDREWYKANHPLYETALGAYEWELEERYHPDVFVGTMAQRLIETRRSHKPLFLQIGFPGPHPPYDPPRRLIERYQSADFPVPRVSAGEIAAQPHAQQTYRQDMIERNHDAVRWSDHPTDEQLLRLRRFYAANVTLIDEQIGKILQALGQRGYLENAVILFTSDHGDCLGDHGLIEKWSMYDSVVRVPAILWSSDSSFSGKRFPQLIEQFDLAHTLLDFAGLQPQRAASSLSLREGLACGGMPDRPFVFAEHSRDNVFRGSAFMTMVRSKTHKLVYYQDEAYGELYDLRADPLEKQNLWNSAEHAEIRQQLLLKLLDFKSAQMDTRPPRPR